MEKKPTLNKKISIEDFNDFYWYKEELLEFCRSQGLQGSGSKIELENKIKLYLKTGKKINSKKKSIKKKSTFDWSTEILTSKTIITDSYKNSENTRAFFKTEIGEKFKFNVTFMNWMKTSVGKTINDASKAWVQISIEKKENKGPKKIAPQFEYNTYIRDFLKENPKLSRELAIECWKIKKSIRGDNKYKKTDLNLIENQIRSNQK